jgi:hypothetical protein
MYYNNVYETNSECTFYNDLKIEGFIKKAIEIILKLSIALICYLLKVM